MKEIDIEKPNQKGSQGPSCTTTGRPKNGSEGPSCTTTGKPKNGPEPSCGAGIYYSDPPQPSCNGNSTTVV